MQDLWFAGLFVLALAIGWFLGRRQAVRIGVMPGPHGSALDRQYFIGLNHLLDEQPDEALEAFVRALEINPETVETHIAIGKLFRQRGDVQRAIRIHQNLLARPALPTTQSDRVQLELARNYLAVGLDPRAGQLLDQLIAGSSVKAEALADRVRLSERERDWQQAVEYGTLLCRERPQFAVTLSHYYCELAEKLLRAGSVRSARSRLRMAMKKDPRSLRAMLMLAELEHEQGRPAQARRWLLRLACEDMALIPQSLPLIHRMAAVGQLDVLEYLDKIHRTQAPSTDTLLLQAETVRQRDGSLAAEQLMLRQLQRIPSLQGLLYLVDLRLERQKGNGPEQLLELRQIIRSLYAVRMNYRCDGCGFSAKAMHWQCPACHAWSTMRRLDQAEPAAAQTAH